MISPIEDALSTTKANLSESLTAIYGIFRHFDSFFRQIKHDKPVGEIEYQPRGAQHELDHTQQPCPQLA